MTTDIAKIAAGLTKAQREALGLLSEEWWAGPSMPEQLLRFIAFFREHGLCERAFSDEVRPAYKFHSDGLSVRFSACWFFRLTPLGVEVQAAVREYLETNNG